MQLARKISVLDRAVLDVLDKVQPRQLSYTKQDAAKILGMSAKSAIPLWSDHGGPVRLVELGGVLRVPYAELVRVVNELVEGSGAEPKRAASS